MTPQDKLELHTGESAIKHKDHFTLAAASEG